MFRTGSPYSPFFTSGLLSESFDSSSSSTTGSQYIDYRRRGSLPDVASGHAASPPKAADQSAFYFTLQPKRDANEFRSFLSLDLAESQSLRSGSEKQRISSTTASFWSGGASKLEYVYIFLAPHILCLTKCLQANSRVPYSSSTSLNTTSAAEIIARLSSRDPIAQTCPIVVASRRPTLSKTSMPINIHVNDTLP